MILRRCPAIDQGEKALLAGVDRYCWPGGWRPTLAWVDVGSGL